VRTIVFCGLGLLLIGLATPPLMARLAALPTNDLYAALQANKSLSGAELASLKISRLQAYAHHPMADDASALAQTVFTQATQTSGSDAAVLYAEAEDWQQAALAAKPTDPLGWYRLALIDMKQDNGASLRGAAAWTQSMAVGPYEPELMIPRLQVGLAHYPYLSVDARAYLPMLIRGGARFDMDGLAQAAKASGTTAVIERVLANDEEKLRAFQERTHQ